MLGSVSRRALLHSAALLPAAAVSVRPARAAIEQPQQRILVFGDSQAQGLAGGIQRAFRGDRSRRVLDRSKISTGLVPRSNFDWVAQAKLLATTERANVAIAMFGANDRPPAHTVGQYDPEVLNRFTERYGAAVADIAAAFHDANVPLAWVGHPLVRDAAFAEDMQVLDDIYSDRAGAEGATFISTWESFRGPDDLYSAFGRGVDGQTTRLRADDGVHMTPAGYDVITEMVLPFINDHLPSDRG